MPHGLPGQTLGRSILGTPQSVRAIDVPAIRAFRDRCYRAGDTVVTAAGGIVTDLAGEPWTADSKSALAAAPGVHERMLEIVKSVGVPEDYL